MRRPQTPIASRGVQVRRARAEDVPRLAGVLAEAFSSDPPMCWFVPDGARRRRLLHGYFAAAVPKVYMRVGEAYMTEDPLGAALWVAPGRAPVRLWDELAALPAMLRTFARRPLRAVRGLALVESGHPREPHWCLEYIAVSAAARSRGAGSALLEAKLADCDREGIPAYLNAGSARSRDLYARHGFEVTECFRLPMGGPPLWRMWREPHGGPKARDRTSPR
jgi:GNAT superfamily N-acetyltransferase